MGMQPAQRTRTMHAANMKSCEQSFTPWRFMHTCMLSRITDVHEHK